MAPEMEAPKPCLNPSHITCTPENMDCLRNFAIDAEYILPQDPSESCKAYRCRVYNTMHVLLSELPTPPELRIERLWPTADWTLIWRNMHGSPFNATTKVSWYKAIHDFLPMRTPLHKTRLVPKELCDRCAREDTVQHLLTDCDGQRLWDWTRQRIAIVLRMD
jgi:hypothetical protein